ncbi:MAG: T9SS type A sorting domain-containing protein [Bacteroidales bacterium]|nr:T9SS type A sorting domain-containing protein [Bacteroidales bacterium]
MKNILTLSMLLITTMSIAQTYELKSYVISNGGGFNSGGNNFSVVGEPVVKFGINSPPYSGGIGFLVGASGNTAPVAGFSVTPSYSVLSGISLTLNGSTSYDPEGDPLTYSWSCPGFSIPNSTQANTGFVAPNQLVYHYHTLSLIVSDGLLSDTATATIMVTNPGWVTVIYPNSAVFYGTVSLCNPLVPDTLDLLGTFINGECRGTVNPMYYAGQWWVVFLIQGTSPQTIEFNYYDYSEDAIYTINPVPPIILNPGYDMGSPTNPIILEFCDTALCTPVIVSQSSNSTCFGANNGWIDITVSGCTTPYTYSWSNGATTQDINSLSAGTYSVTVFDAAGISASTSITITQPAVLQLNDAITHVSCYGGSNGAISLTVTGGTSPYLYNWGASGTSQNLSNKSAGTYNLTVTDTNGCSTVNTFIVSQPDMLSASFVVTNVSSSGGSDGALNLTVQGGTPSYTYSWSTGATTEDISNLTVGSYTVTVTDVNFCSATFSASVGLALPTAPSWHYEITSSNHSILITDTIPMTINGIQIVPGDYLGVFYDSLGTLACGGYVQWQGSTTMLAAIGTDVGNDGFVVGEAFKWKIWDASTNTEYNASATYMSPSAFLPNQGFFTNNGMSGLASLNTFETQNISLPIGWSMFSSYINPYYPLMDSVFSNIVSNVSIVKNGSGQAFWPAFNLNLIPNLIVCEGYQIKMLSSNILNVKGIAVQPQNTICSVPIGWSILGYLRKMPGDVATMLSSISPNIIIVKNGNGQAYWPIFGLNLIGNMTPGEGYQIKTNAACNLTYPANTVSYSKSEILDPEPTHFGKAANTGNNMILGILLQERINGEIGIFIESGLLIGSAIVEGNFTAITLWGDDETTPEIDGLLTGEEFEIMVWDKETNKESLLVVESWLEGDGRYETNKIAIAEKISIMEDNSYRLYQNVPNPFTLETEFGFYLPEKTYVEFTILNMLGEKVENLIDEEMIAGKHSLKYQTRNLNAGIYYYKLETPDFSVTKKMVVVK